MQVLDAAGAPAADVPVGLQCRMQTTGPFVHLRATSDARGKARIAHAGFGLACILDGWDAESVATTTWSIAPEICAANRPEVAVDPDALPTAPIELRLPQLGEVEVVVLRADGEPALLDLQPQLMFASDLPEDVGTGPMRPWFRAGSTHVRAEDVEGHALFRLVGLDGELALKVQPNSASSKSWVECLRGPTKAGERVTVTMTLAGDVVTCVGRLVDERGAPLAKHHVDADLFSRPSPNRAHFVNFPEKDTLHAVQGALTTDERGRFMVIYGSDAACGGEPLLVLCDGRNEPDSLAARVELGASWTVGLHDLGNIALTSTPIVASGAVFDTEGRPVAGAPVEIGVFKGQSYIVTMTNAGGEFVLRSAEPHDRLRISVDAPGYLTEFVQAAVGAHDLRVVLTGAGSIVGPVVFPANTRFGDFYFHVERTVQGRSSHGWTEQHPEEGELNWTNLEAGTYRVFVRRGSEGESILARDAISVSAGETTRIEAIDLIELLGQH
ncbi:MAG: carboxypeptidase-like regulatory domain-containing protein [Planctomycetes bacterium]|nr:carboxypeptidase-like regulatory domain-containing protein [Planctomycetota bacterium]